MGAAELWNTIMDDEIDRFIAEEEDDAYEEQLEYLDEQQEGDVSPVGLSEHEKNLSGWGRPALESQSTGDTRIGAHIAQSHQRKCPG